MALQIGTASFANRYGLMNKEILEDSNEIKKMIDFCINKNLLLDSSPAYGSSLDSIVKSINTRKARIATKVLVGKQSINQFSTNLKKHIKSLELCDIEILYFHEPKISHNEEFLNFQRKAFEICQEFEIPKLGLSIYSPDDLCDTYIDFNILNIIQCPINLLDTSNLILFKKYPSIEIVSRSILMQGLLTENGIKLLQNSENNQDRENAIQIISLAKNNYTNIETLSMAFVLMHEEIQNLLIGVNSFEQLLMNYHQYNDALKLARILKHQIKDINSLSRDGSIFKRWWPKLAPDNN